MTPSAGRSKALLSREQEAAARAACSEGCTQAEVAERIGVTIDTLRARLRDQLADLKLPRRVNSGRRSRDPTEEEIYGRLTLIEQQAWSDEERAERWMRRG